MATLIDKLKEFKNISDEMDVGGAPIYADDFIRLQKNAKADIVNFFESLRRQLPEFLVSVSGASPTKEFESGIILSGFEYENTGPSEGVVSEGYFLSGGDICYYPGGTYAKGLNPLNLFIYKGAPSYESRVFNDGSSKEILISYAVEVETSTRSTNNVALPSGTSITSSDEVIVLELGSSEAVLEKNFTPQAALNFSAILDMIPSTWSDVLTQTPFTVLTENLTGAKWREYNDGTIQIKGSFSVNMSGASFASTDSTEDLFKIPSVLVDTTNLSSFSLPCLVEGGGTVYPHHLRVIKSGSETIFKINSRFNPATNDWPGSGTLRIHVNTEFMKSPSHKDFIQASAEFLNIT